MPIVGFDSQPRTRLVFGLNSIEKLGELARELSAHRVLIVTDRGIAVAGHLERAARMLLASGLEVVVFDRVRENPTTLDVDNCLEVAKSAEIDTIVGLGGGSSLDTAKGCNFLLTNGGRMQDYWGFGKATQAMLPLIAIPTTSGTGSECQSFALIADETTHQKMACGDPKAAARIALLDPTLTLSQPRGVTACTGIDAIVHAVETAVTKKRNELSWLYSREAFRLLIQHFDSVLATHDNLEARSGMLLGAAYAGMAIENSMLGAAHSMANPLTAHFGVIHGQAVGVMLPHVVRFNAQLPEVRESYRELVVSAGLAAPDISAEQAVTTLITALQQALSKAGISPFLIDHGVTEDSVSTLVVEATTQMTARYNPRAVSIADFTNLYCAALRREGQ